MHDPQDLMAIVRKRGKDPQKVTEVICKSCGATAATNGGVPMFFGHFPGCWGDPDQLVFRIPTDKTRAARA